MRPVAVVVVDVFVDHSFEVSTTEDERPVKTFTSDSPDEALSEGVGPGRFYRRSNDADTLCPEDLVEAGGELGVAIPDQELEWTCTLGEFVGQISGLLDYPGAGRIWPLLP